MFASIFPKRMLFSAFSNFQKCIFYHKNCVSQTFHSDMIVVQKTGPCVKGSFVFCLNIIRNMAGHSKWQNVQHIKAAKDKEKQIACNKYAYLIRLAIREGGKDPKVNNKLASIIEQAKKNNVPLSTVENAMKIDIKKDKFGTVELLGPGGCILVLEYETDNISTIRHDIKVACKKNNAHVLSGEGRWRSVYEQKGIIKAVARKDGLTLDAEEALDDAILAGAEEVSAKEDDNKNVYLEFLCPVDDLNQAKKEIETNYLVEEGYIAYLPITTVELSDADMTDFENLLENLGSLTDVIRIYENVQ